MKTQSITTLAAALAAAFLLCAAPIAHAETAKKSDKEVVDKTKATKPAAVKAAAAKADKPAAKKKAEKPGVSASRTNLKSAAVNVAAGVQAAEAAMTPAELAIAEQVQVGKMPCELGASVTLTADAKNPGYFDLQGKNFSYRMFPVATSTGAIRLEDQKAGAVWLQLANKSMLMSQKQGIRLADECTSPAQLVVAQNLKLNPPASILDAPPPVVANPVPAK
ncbi:Probable signal peptide protein [Polaromonas sp. CG9_12]|nr:Probable signal peptide protein [Polaromonas sp. CG9_12]